MTNLRYIHHAVNPPVGGERPSLDTEPAYIDLVTFELPGNVHSYTLRFHLERWSDYYLDRRVHTSTLKRADGVIFVVDSQARKLQDNIACWNELQELLGCLKKDVAKVPLVMHGISATC
ncbi:hypothetical protein KSF_000020 [Reticulibacter mediterranei]|uniref:Uncharacterized protein n=1 Tax=Reticulibacter mediterranei TaxID=2778369 RepID=A0A8J3I713_9CHLR|nr:hypothetical protein [Reticulibacter mediterranei]GHO89954.1 hypothetical protein KSF_000020 [Reticulibacter mediterranei]